MTPKLWAKEDIDITNNDNAQVSGRKTFINFGFLVSGKTLGDLLAFVLFIVLSRAFGKEGIGQYSFAMAFSGFFVVFAEFGLYSFAIKELNRDTGSLTELYGRIIFLRFLLTLLVFGVLILLIPFLPFSYETKLVIAIIGGYQLLSRVVDGFAAVFVAREDMHVAALLQASLQAAATVLGSSVVLAGGTLIMALSTLPAAAFVQLFIAYGLLTKKYGRPNFLSSYYSLRGLLRDALPYGISLLLFQLYSRTDVVLLGFFLGAAAAGIYNVAYRVVFLLMFIPHFVGISLFPQASRMYVNSRSELETLYHKSLNAIILVGLPAAVGLWLIAPELIDLIFGESFSESSSILRMLAALLLFACFNRLMGVFLMACDRQVERTKSQWKAALINVLANILLIPSLHIKGAALATLFSETALVFLFVQKLRPVLGLPRIGSRLAMSAVATASFFLPITLMSSKPIYLIVPVSAIIYVTTLSLFNDIRRKELLLLFEFFKRAPKICRSSENDLS